jgi:hypothetical protein
MECRHCGVDQLALKPREAPGLCSELHNSLHRNFDAFLLSRIGEVLDSTDDFFDDSSSGSIDTLLGTAAGESREQGLLTPDCFLSCAFVANVVAHRGEKRISFVVATT